MRFDLFFLISLIFFACNSYTEQQENKYSKEAKSFCQKHNWTFEQSSSGLCKSLISEGEGEQIQSKSVVTIKYVGKLLNGKVFDQTKEKPLKAPLSGLIQGFQEGFIGHKKGAKLKFLVPPQVGYGEQELDKIPANSLLIFDVEILEVE